MNLLVATADASAVALARALIVALRAAMADDPGADGALQLRWIGGDEAEGSATVDASGRSPVAASAPARREPQETGRHAPPGPIGFPAFDGASTGPSAGERSAALEREAARSISAVPSPALPPAGAVDAIEAVPSAARPPAGAVDAIEAVPSPARPPAGAVDAIEAVPSRARPPAGAVDAIEAVPGLVPRSVRAIDAIEAVPGLVPQPVRAFDPIGAVPSPARPSAGAVGPIEVAARLPAILRHRAALRRAILRDRPDVLLTVDSPALHLPIAAWARRRGVRTAHLVCPQIWASRPWRIRAIRRAVDHVLCLLPFEPALLARGGVRGTFVGHPRAWPERPVADGPPTLLLAPGSRPAELRQHLAPLVAVARLAQRAQPDLRIEVARAPTVAARELAALGGTIIDEVRETRAHVAVAASGTITLELAALGVPQVVLYRVHPLSYLLARRLITVSHIALPNLLAGRGVVAEHVQRLDPRALAADALALLGEAGDAQRVALRPAIAATRDPDGMARAAGILRALAAGGAGP